MENMIGKTISHYQILEQLGEGGMATVFKAYDTNLEREVAIKIIRREAFPPEQSDQLLKRFEREAKSLARMSHPNIVKVLDYGEYGNSPYLVLEYLPGGTLKDKLGKPMPWQEAARLLLPIAEALDYAHSQNIIHRDVKPANILLTQRGQPMLSDFGIAKLLESGDAQTLTGTGMGIGTPEYMAPEQWSGKVSSQTDIYALGVVFYELVTGHKPYTADTPAEILLKQATEPLPRPMSFVPGLPEDVEKVLEKAMAKNPADRYVTMQAFAQALEDLLGRKAEVQQTTLNQPGTAPKPTTLEVETTRVNRLPDLPPATLIKPSEKPHRARLVISWKLWVAAAVIVVLVGIGVVLGGGLIKTAKPGAKPTTIPLGSAATNTFYRIMIPTRTETLVPSSTPLPSVTATPLLHMGQSLVSKPGTGDYYAFSFSTDGQTVIRGAYQFIRKSMVEYTGTYMITIDTYSLANLDLVNSFSFPDPSQSSTTVAGILMTSHQIIASGQNNGSVWLYNSDGTLMKNLPAVGGGVLAISFSADAQTMAVSHMDNSIRLYKVSDGSLLQTLGGQKTNASTMAFSPDRQTLASGAVDKVYIWRVSDGSLLQTLQAGSTSYSLAFSSDGGILGSGHKDGTIRLWRVSDGSQLHTLKGSSPVDSVAFSPDGQLLASGSWDKTVRLWRVSDGSLLQTLKGHIVPVRNVAFTPDGQLLVSTSVDGSVRLWGILP